ncbi:hypothetical protein [Falsibacillus albus]|uniref:DUF4878 domain-containing protein n=1 Tax=Falsibacillus albus TaxID=2478915 RepID=A0A3L7K1A9_9BACI|nr:hypothetical protein [Falsibacillus albus]RLQ96867.1 hypothetical protein D9X91_07155 [Falsibacillus albus]
MRRRTNWPLYGLIGLLVAVAVLIAGIVHYFTSGKHSAEKVVDSFYHYEQKGDFGSSWKLFDSYMKEKMPKEQYVQLRPHVFMQDFQAKSFKYTIGHFKKLDEWNTLSDGRHFTNLYETTVTQTYETSFGEITIEQKCYTVKEKGEWRMVWDY